MNVTYVWHPCPFIAPDVNCNETEMDKMLWYDKTHSRMQKPHDEIVYITLETTLCSSNIIILIIKIPEKNCDDKKRYKKRNKKGKREKLAKYSKYFLRIYIFLIRNKAFFNILIYESKWNVVVRRKNNVAVTRSNLENWTRLE